MFYGTQPRRIVMPPAAFRMIRGLNSVLLFVFALTRISCSPIISEDSRVQNFNSFFFLNQGTE